MDRVYAKLLQTSDCLLPAMPKRLPFSKNGAMGCRTNPLLWEITRLLLFVGLIWRIVLYRCLFS